MALIDLGGPDTWDWQNPGQQPQQTVYPTDQPQAAPTPIPSGFGYTNPETPIRFDQNPTVTADPNNPYNPTNPNSNNTGFTGLAPSPAPNYSSVNPNDFGAAWQASGGRTTADLAAFVRAHPEYGATIGGTKGDKVTVGGRSYDAVLASGEGGGQGAQWIYLDPNNPGGGSAAGGGQSLGNIFSDPATTQWETALNNLASQLQQPRVNPDVAPLLDYLRSYFGQLQQPGATPAQQEIMQTQTLDPLEHQRAAARQQVVQRFAARGITPQSGIVEKALQDLDQQFNQLRTQTQGQFATNQIQQDQQRQAQAAQVGASIAGLQDQQAGSNENRIAQAVALLAQVPQLADQRLALANQTLIPTNPANLLNLQQQYSQQGQQASQFAQSQAQQQSQYQDAQMQQYLYQIGQWAYNVINGVS